MTRRRWWIIAAIVATAIIAVANAGFALSNRVGSNCDVVRSMIDYNNQFNQNVSGKTEAKIETPEADYTRWSLQLRAFADQIHDDPSLTKQADSVADLAEQFAAIIPRFRAESSARSPLEKNPPPSVREFSRVSQEFNASLIELDKACPG